MNINGARGDNVNFLLDGFNAQETRLAGSAVQPPLDSMQEFKMQTTNYSAEYGRLAGGVMNMVLKAGGNRAHGSLFEFVRNDKLDARNFFDSDKAKLRRNQFGATLSRTGLSAQDLQRQGSDLFPVFPGKAHGRWRATAVWRARPPNWRGLGTFRLLWGRTTSPSACWIR